jgi:hypothetical protein
MNNRFFRYLAASALAAALALASPALAMHGGGGGGGGGGGMHGGGMGGGFGGGMHGMGGGWSGGGWSHVGGMGSHDAMMPYSRAAFSPQVSHFGSHFAFHDRDDFRRGVFRHRFHRFAFFGAPYDDYYYADYGYDGCVRQVSTRYGLQWVNVCGYGDYGY